MNIKSLPNLCHKRLSPNHFNNLERLRKDKSLDATKDKSDVSVYTNSKQNSRKSKQKRRIPPKAPLVAKPASALSSAVSTISTITLTEMEDNLIDKHEGSDEVKLLLVGL